MAYTPINNGDTGLTAREAINEVGTGLDTHAGLSGSGVHSLGTMSTQSASAVIITGGSVILQNAKFGTATDNTRFEDDGTLVMSGSATVWTDIFFPLVTAKQGQTDKPAFDATEIGYLFPQNDTGEFMYIIAQFPHSRKQGTNLSPHVHWKQTQSGSPVFKIDYKWFPIGGAVPATFDTLTMSTPAVTYTSGSMHQLTYGAKISGSMISETGMGVSSVMLIKLYRDSDLYAGNAVVYQFDIHYEIDSIGSHQEFVK